MMSEPTPQTVHVALGGIAGAALEEIASPVIVDDDNLLLGPSSANATRHRALRARYWGSAPSSDLERELARAAGPILCVDLPPTPGGLLSLCRICDRAIEQGRNVSVIALGSEAAAAPSQGIGPARAVYLDGEAILRDRPPAVQWSKLQTAFAATLWRLWCRRSPVAFSRFCASGGALHPQLANLGRYHAGFFPRASEGLLLSRLDELVLRQLSRDWMTPTQVFMKSAAAGSELDAWVSHTGDMYLAARLLAWSRHMRGRIVEKQRAGEASPSEMTEWSFRWCEGGEAILAKLPSLDAAPRIAVGGAVAHDPEHPWVCRLDAAGIPSVSQGKRFGA